MKETEDLEEKLNRNSDGITRFSVSLRQTDNPVLYTNGMYFSMAEISKIEKVLSEFGLKIYAIGAEPDADGMYIETERF